MRFRPGIHFNQMEPLVYALRAYQRHASEWMLNGEGPTNYNVATFEAGAHATPT